MEDKKKINPVIKKYLTSIVGGIMMLCPSGVLAEDLTPSQNIQQYESAENAVIENNQEQQTLSYSAEVLDPILYSVMVAIPVPTEEELQAKYDRLENLESKLAMSDDAIFALFSNKAIYLQLESERKAIFEHDVAIFKKDMVRFKDSGYRDEKLQNKITQDLMVKIESDNFLKKMNMALLIKSEHLMFADSFMQALDNNSSKDMVELINMGMPLREYTGDDTYQPITVAASMALQGDITPDVLRVVVNAVVDKRDLKEPMKYVLAVEKMDEDEQMQFNVTYETIESVKKIFMDRLSGRSHASRDDIKGIVTGNTTKNRQYS